MIDAVHENVLWQFFSGQVYFEHRLPCDATQVGRFRRALGEDGLEELIKATIDTAVTLQAVQPQDGSGAGFFAPVAQDVWGDAGCLRLTIGPKPWTGACLRTRGLPRSHPDAIDPGGVCNAMGERKTDFEFCRADYKG